ncbi:MAG: hypothetical protein WCF24_00565, partial [Acidimicrobiales bacterium]
MSEAREHFVFGPRDRRGLIAGARTGQLAVVASGLSLALVSLHVLHGRARIPIVVATVFVSIAAVSWPIGGRTVDEWFPILVAFCSKSVVRTNRSIVGVAMTTASARRPPIFESFAIEEVSPINAPSFGVLIDRRMSSASALIELGGESYALLSEAERMRRVERWSGVLASIARDA